MIEITDQLDRCQVVNKALQVRGREGGREREREREGKASDLISPLTFAALHSSCLLVHSLPPFLPPSSPLHPDSPSGARRRTGAFTYFSGAAKPSLFAVFHFHLSL